MLNASGANKIEHQQKHKNQNEILTTNTRRQWNKDLKILREKKSLCGDFRFLGYIQSKEAMFALLEAEIQGVVSCQQNNKRYLSSPLSC